MNSMRILTVLLLACTALVAADVIDAFGYHWTVPVASDWRVEQGPEGTILHLATHRGPLPGPRRPIQFALAETRDYGTVRVELDARPLGRSLMIVFSYRNPAHFDYAHLSIDPATKEHVHNGIFHVYGGERVRISSEAGRAAFAETNRWYHVRLVHDGQSGSVEVSVDGQPIPALHAVDVSLLTGKVGIGSFDETADFRNVKIQGEQR